MDGESDRKAQTAARPEIDIRSPTMFLYYYYKLIMLFYGKSAALYTFVSVGGVSFPVRSHAVCNKTSKSVSHSMSLTVFYEIQHFFGGLSGDENEFGYRRAPFASRCMRHSVPIPFFSLISPLLDSSGFDRSFLHSAAAAAAADNNNKKMREEQRRRERNGEVAIREP